MGSTTHIDDDNEHPEWYLGLEHLFIRNKSDLNDLEEINYDNNANNNKGLSQEIQLLIMDKNMNCNYSLGYGHILFPKCDHQHSKSLIWLKKKKIENEKENFDIDNNTNMNMDMNMNMNMNKKQQNFDDYLGLRFLSNDIMNIKINR